MGFISGLAYWGKSLLKGIAWPAAKMRGDRRLGRIVLWSLHFLALACILVGLGLLNHWSGLDRLLRVPQPILRTIWLPLIFLSLYLASWCAWWLTRLLRTQPEGSEWPDIDRAWSEATQAIEQAGIDLRAVPLYLLLGRPAGDTRSLFAAAQVPLSVTQTPRTGNAPIHVFANSDAIYVTCADTSLLGRHAALLAERSTSHHELTAAIGGAEVDTNEFPFVAEYGNQDRGELDDRNTVESLQSAVALLVEEEPSPKSVAPAPTPIPDASLLEQPEIIERTILRLHHLCTLIARDREPYCPVNGLLVLLPFAASDDELTAGETAVLLERDLLTIRQSLDVRCPLVTLICDLEETPGGSELLTRFPRNQRNRRLGVSYPLLAQCDSKQTPEMIQSGVHWTCQDLVPPLVYRLAQIQSEQGAADADQFLLNSRLYHLVTQLRQRETRFTRLLQRAYCPDQTSPWLIAGCYLAATGEDAVRGQGFAGGIVPQLLQMQNHVTWTREAIRDDRFCRRLAVAGYAAVATAIVLVIAATIAL